MKRGINGSWRFFCNTNREGGEEPALNSNLNRGQEWRERWMLASGELMGGINGCKENLVGIRSE